MLSRPVRVLTLLLAVIASQAAIACGGSDDSSDSGAWRIGLEAPLSGDQSVLGKGMLEGAQLASSRINANGGLLGSRSR